ncbi:lysis system i-spanin subunit Rz [Vibrio gangliei]|uniref:lysis system i-spanin subunit Rz n=1 Tax=Vibrio gangliei TaxID=2077090 RepID=UPI000D011BC5|nr:lysis system i-spanin subunit Rz [Vibrio gangliei]
MLSNGYIKSVGIILVAILILTVFIQHEKNEQLRSKLDDALVAVTAAQGNVAKMQEQNEKMAKQYVKQQKEYEDAQAEVSQLKRDLADNSKRLRIKATCDQPVSAKSSASSLDDERTAELTRDSERTYIRLRNQITTITAQINGLRSYIEALPRECVAK